MSALAERGKQPESFQMEMTSCQAADLGGTPLDLW